MKTYLDVLYKTQYYRDKVLKDLIRKGVSPSRLDVEAAVGKIDRFLALYKGKSIEAGTAIDMKEFYESFKTIEHDLKILYRIVYEIALIEYQALYLQVDNHLKGLESMAESMKRRSSMEIGSSSVGETIYYKGSEFETYTVNEDVFVELGKIKLHESERIALLFDGENVDPENVLMNIQNEDLSLFVAPYNYMQDTLIIPGERSKRSYTYSEKEDQIINSGFQINAEGLLASPESDYRILGGKDCITVLGARGEAVQKIDENNSYYSFEPGVMTFYIHKGSYARFSFTKMPQDKNFSGTFIDHMGDLEKIVIESQGDLGFEIITDGKVYAEVAKGLVKEGKLFYPKRSNARDFLIEESFRGKEIVADAYLKIASKDGAPVKIKSITIKSMLQ